jgi:hypothetical protein
MQDSRESARNRFVTDAVRNDVGQGRRSWHRGNETMSVADFASGHVRRSRPKLLTPFGWFTTWALIAVAAGALLGFAT